MYLYFTTTSHQHHVGEIHQKPAHIRALQAIFPFAGYCECDVDGRMPCDTNVVLCSAWSSDCQSDSKLWLFDLREIVDHDVEIAILQYATSNQLTPIYSHTADFFF
jgi:hypothetical protein